MYHSSLSDNDDDFPHTYTFHNFDDHSHKHDSYFGPPLWVIIPFAVIFTFVFGLVVYGIIKTCCCGNTSTSARPMYSPPVRVGHTYDYSHSTYGGGVVASAPIYDTHSSQYHSHPPVIVHHTNEKPHDSHAVSNDTSHAHGNSHSHSHSVCHDSPPSYAAAVGSDSGATCTADSGATCTDSGDVGSSD